MLKNLQLRGNITLPSYFHLKSLVQYLSEMPSQYCNVACYRILKDVLALSEESVSGKANTENTYGTYGVNASVTVLEEPRVFEEIFVKIKVASKKRDVISSRKTENILFVKLKLISVNCKYLSDSR